MKFRFRLLVDLVQLGFRFGRGCLGIGLRFVDAVYFWVQDVELLRNSIPGPCPVARGRCMSRTWSKGAGEQCGSFCGGDDCNYLPVPASQVRSSHSLKRSAV